MGDLGQNFYPKLVQVSNELGMKPEDLLAVMTSESGINPSAYESKSHGSGLLGFMPNTLKGLGFTGSWKDFIGLKGEDQLDYVKKLIQNNMAVNGGKPFGSAALYYTANLWPIALKLPGIQAGNPDTAFIEENPDTITDPKTGKKYSKKYYELGYRISPDFEKAAYKANPLFHGSTQGAITYADMMRQVDKNKRNPIYQKAVAQMEQQTGYQSNKTTDIAQQTQEPKEDIVSSIESLFSKFLSTTANKKVYLKKISKKYIPYSSLLIKVNADNFWNAMEYSRILCIALDEEFDANTTIHTDLKNIEIQCKMVGNAEICKSAIFKLSSKISTQFIKATKKIGNVAINTKVLSNIKPNYQECSIKLAELSYDVFHKTFRN